MSHRLTSDQIAQLKGLAVGGWKAGRSSDYTNWSLRTVNLNTARAFFRKGLLHSPAADRREWDKDIRPGDPLAITQAGRDWLEENAQ